MTMSSSRHAASDGLPERLVTAVGGFLAVALGPMAALAPRGLPVWAILVTLVAAAGLARSHSLGRLVRAALPIGLAGAFLLLALLSTLWSPSPRALATVAELGYIALGALFGGAWLSQLPGAEARRLVRLLLAGLIIGILVFGGEVLANFPIYRWWNGVSAEDAAAILYSNVPKRSSALLCLLVWPAALAVARLGRRAAALLVPVGYALLCLPLTSRSATLGIGIGLAFYLLARWSGALARRVLGVLVAVAFVAVLPLVLMLDRVLDLTRASWLFTSAQHRVEIWGMAATRALETPLLGQGIDASRALPPHGEVSRFSPITDSLLPLHPHNAFLQVWLELGAVGAALALALTLLLLNGVKRLDEADQPFALALFATGLAMISTAYGVWQAWWMASFLAAGLTLRLATRVPTDGR